MNSVHIGTCACHWIVLSVCCFSRSRNLPLHHMYSPLESESFSESEGSESVFSGVLLEISAIMITCFACNFAALAPWRCAVSGTFFFWWALYNLWTVFHADGLPWESPIINAYISYYYDSNKMKHYRAKPSARLQAIQPSAAHMMVLCKPWTIILL